MKPRRRGHRRRAHLERQVELNIVSFMNLMVVLVPFLLTTAVFSRMSVLSIDIPTPATKADLSIPPPPPPDELPYRLALELAADGVVIQSGKQTLPEIPRGRNGSYDTVALRAALGEVLTAHPTHQAVDILSRPDSPYEDLVTVMDANAGTDGSMLFPNIRLGEYLPVAAP